MIKFSEWIQRNCSRFEKCLEPLLLSFHSYRQKLHFAYNCNNSNLCGTQWVISWHCPARGLTTTLWWWWWSTPVHWSDLTVSSDSSIVRLKSGAAPHQHQHSTSDRNTEWRGTTWVRPDLTQHVQYRVNDIGNYILIFSILPTHKLHLPDKPIVCNLQTFHEKAV